MTTETVTVVLWEDAEDDLIKIEPYDNENFKPIDKSEIDKAILDRYVWWQAEGKAIQKLLEPLYEGSFA